MEWKENGRLGRNVRAMHHRARHSRTIHLRAIHARVTHLRKMHDMRYGKAGKVKACNDKA
jgi:hypothetical protein